MISAHHTFVGVCSSELNTIYVLCKKDEVYEDAISQDGTCD